MNDPHSLYEQRIHEMEVKQEESFKRLWELEMQAVRSEQVNKGIEDTLKEIKMIVRGIQEHDNKDYITRNKHLLQWLVWAAGIAAAIFLKGV